MATNQMSRYIQTSWMLDAEKTLTIPDIRARVRHFSEREAFDLEEKARKRNVFARHSWENNFYLQRIRDLASKTVIEVSRPGDPDDMIDEAQRAASLIERLSVLSTTLGIRRPVLQRWLAVNVHRRSTFDITIGPGFHYMRSKSRPGPDVKGIRIDNRFCWRFERCGFRELASFLLTGNEIAKRLVAAINWLFESLGEPILSAAIVKTSIALESLLIFSETEPLAKSLSERAAFVLSSDVDARAKIHRAFKMFYNVRSGIVHGSRKRAKKLTPLLFEGIDRLALLMCLMIAANSDKWASGDSLLDWCENQRWGAPASDARIPFPGNYLGRAISLVANPLE